MKFLSWHRNYNEEENCLLHPLNLEIYIFRVPADSRKSGKPGKWVLFLNSLGKVGKSHENTVRN